MSRSYFHPVRSSLFALALGSILLVSGCTTSVHGPTDPVEFIKEGKRWNSINPRDTATGPVVEPPKDEAPLATAP